MPVGMVNGAPAPDKSELTTRTKSNLSRQNGRYRAPLMASRNNAGSVSTRTSATIPASGSAMSDQGGKTTTGCFPRAAKRVGTKARRQGIASVGRWLNVGTPRAEYRPAGAAVMSRAVTCNGRIAAPAGTCSRTRAKACTSACRACQVQPMLPVRKREVAKSRLANAVPMVPIGSGQTAAARINVAMIGNRRSITAVPARKAGRTRPTTSNSRPATTIPACNRSR